MKAPAAADRHASPSPPSVAVLCTPDLLFRLKKMCEPMPSGSSLTLPVDWLRAELEDIASDEGSAADSAGVIVDLSAAEVAAIVRRSAGTVRQWIREERLRAYLWNGREYRVTRAALNEFLAAQREGGRKGESTASSRRVDLSSWRGVRDDAAA